MIARELCAGRRLNDTTADIRQIMADLHWRFPNDREQSLFASVELSLRKLPPELRAKLPPLGVFHGGGNVVNIAQVLGLDREQGEHKALARVLIDVGLAEVLEYNYYLRFDPALGPFLLRELDDSARAAAEARWAEATAQLTTYFSSNSGILTHSSPPRSHFRSCPTSWRRSSGARAAAAGGAIGVETVIDQADSVEYLLQNLGRPRALQRAVAVRERGAAAVKDSGWSHARHLAESNTIERLIDAGRAAEAVPLALRLLAEATAAGEEAYEDAAYDMAICHARLGRALKESGEAQAALGPLDEARTRFQRLAEAGDRSAVQNGLDLPDRTSRCPSGSGPARRGGRDVRESHRACPAARRSPRCGHRPVPARHGATLQRRYAGSLHGIRRGPPDFRAAGRAGEVAWAWHHMGVLLRRAEQYDAAETAYLNARRVYVDLGDRPKEAATLGELGNLYGAMGRHEDAVRFYREAATIYA